MHYYKKWKIFSFDSSNFCKFKWNLVQLEQYCSVFVGKSELIWVFRFFEQNWRVGKNVEWFDFQKGDKVLFKEWRNRSPFLSDSGLNLLKWNYIQLTNFTVINKTPNSQIFANLATLKIQYPTYPCKMIRKIKNWCFHITIEGKFYEIIVYKELKMK